MMKSRFENREFLVRKWANWSLFLISLVAFFLLNRWTVPAYDDFNYHFIYGKEGLTNIHVTSLYDVITSQYYHYFFQNGRVVVHALLQLLFISDNKIWFDCANTLVFGLLQIALLKSVKLNLSTVRTQFYLLFLLMLWFLLPGPNYCFLWMSGSLNYSWATAAALFLLYIYRCSVPQDKYSRSQLFGLFLAGLFLSATNEVISIGVSVALVVDLILNPTKDLRRVSLTFGSGLATLFVISAPGNYIRLAVLKSQPTSSIPQLITSDSEHPIIAVMAIKLFVLLGIIMLTLFLLNRTYFWRIINEYQIYIVGILTSLIFVYYVHAFSQRALFPASVFALVILLAFVKEYESILSSKLVLSCAILLSVVAIVEYVKATKDLQFNQVQYRNQLANINKSRPEQTIFETVTYRKNRFVCTGLGVSDSRNVANVGMSRMLNRTSLLFLPSLLVEQLAKVESDTVYHLRSLSRLVIPIPHHHDNDFKSATIEFYWKDGLKEEEVVKEYVANHNGKLGLFIVPIPRAFEFKNLIGISIQSASSNHKLEYKIKNR